MGNGSTPAHPTNHHCHGIYWMPLGFQLEESGTCAAAVRRVMDAISVPTISNGLGH